jgi:competence protein ComEC
MHNTRIPIWKEAPFLRLLIPFASGIFAQWHFQWVGIVAHVGLSICTCCMILFSFGNITSQFKRYWIHGFFLNGLLFFAGALLLFIKNGATDPLLVTRLYSARSTVVVRLDEPLSPKLKSYKTIGTLQSIEINDFYNTVHGKIIIYFQKDSPMLQYGTQVIFEKSLQPIKNTGNPGSFDYKRHCQFQQIYYQVFLKPGEYRILRARKINALRQFLFNTRKHIVGILRTNIPGAKESGLAEALLIGYKDDLDKDLIQSYNNTGVVHIIAISGLHVGLIYGLLTLLLTPLHYRRKIGWLKPLFIIAGLWLFSLIAGASPSVLRSAVMFSFVVFGKNFSGKVSVYNSLAASAFLLLCYDPYWLWDVGFQLSYAAVLSIIVFMKPVYNWWYIENKILDAIWKLNAVTLSAQILTLPICLYYFHQFPNFFLITNLIAIPLSSIILLGEVLLCSVAILPGLAKMIGWLLYFLIWLMNTFIERIDRLPYSVFKDLQISLLQLLCMYIVIAGLSMWFLKVRVQQSILALAGLFCFGIVRLHSTHRMNNRQKIIVYNIPSYQAIDFIDGKNYFFKGDSILVEDGFLQNFHLHPSRVLQSIVKKDSLPSLFYEGIFFQFTTMRIIIIEKPLPKINYRKKIITDIIIISKNPAISMDDVNAIFSCKQIIFDASNRARQISGWITDCNTLRIPYYSVPDKGAFVMNMN